MTTTPPAPASVPPRGVDAELAGRCEDHGQYLAGLIATGMLEHVGTPAKLPELLFPDADPQLVRAIWQTAMPVGVNLGRYLSRPRATKEGLDRLRAALYDSSHEAMARLADRSANTVTPHAHPADPETDTTRAGRP